jgi:hypothetical protein
MARRHISSEKLSVEELEVYRMEVAALDRRSLEIHYKALHNACPSQDMRVPSPEVVQQFVQVWRRLRELKGTARLWP